jgi:hypothetical protein
MSVHDWRKLSAQRDDLVRALRGLADCLEHASTVAELDRLMRWQFDPPPSTKTAKKVSVAGGKSRAAKAPVADASTFLTAAEAALYLRFKAADPARAFSQWAARHAVPVCKRGRTSLWLAADLDDAVRGPRETRRQIQQASRRSSC